MLLLMLTAAACRARGLAAARSLSRRSVRLRAGSTKTLDALREELDRNNVELLGRRGYRGRHGRRTGGLERN